MSGNGNLVCVKDGECTSRSFSDDSFFGRCLIRRLGLGLFIMVQGAGQTECCDCAYRQHCRVHHPYVLLDSTKAPTYFQPDSRWNRFAENIGGHWRITDAHCSSCIASRMAVASLYRREHNRFLRQEWFVDDCGQKNAVYDCSDALCCPFDHSADNCRSRSGRGGMLYMRNHHAYTQTLVLCVGVGVTKPRKAVPRHARAQ